MKNILLIVVIFLISCKPKPEFEIDGKQYYTITRCILHHDEYKWEFHFGMDWSGEYSYHYGPHTVSYCLKTRIDTIEIK